MALWSNVSSNYQEIVYLDRAKETSSTTGSGTILNLNGPVQGFQALSGIGSGDFIPYEDGFDYCVDALGNPV